MTESTGLTSNAVFVDQVVLIRPVGGEAGALRAFSADIETLSPDTEEPAQIGAIEGWIGWDVEEQTLLEDADAVDGEALELAEKAVKGLRELSGMVDAVVLISEIDLVAGYDGPGFSVRAVESLLDMLRLDPDGIVVVGD